MQIRIYQLKTKDTTKEKRFVSYQTALELGGVNAADYQLAYSGDIIVEDMQTALEDIFTVCNTTKPLGYNGHSLSISDIIEIREWNSYFYVDSFGFQKLDSFKAELTDIDSTVRILICEQDRHPYVSEISTKHRLEALQHIVGGNLEAFKITDGITGWCNEEGRLTELPLNRIINGNPIYGTFFISGTDEKDISSLDPEQIDLMTSKLYYPAIREVREAY